MSNAPEPKVIPAEPLIPDERLERQESIKELYQYALKRLDTERDRFNRVDEKANKMATVFVFVMGALLFFVRLMERNLPPKTILDWILVILTLLTLFTSFVGWYYC